ncbi:uncharacterized protein LOC116298358 [Actinia tenebrosa]|uniref:Uncharacterized protein LOC116298358 n=1 Tax=Actinia tenebrosa TaxID=6105 RepID=A0A6P8IB77_ACTTE|nr:uncharacterized protein LOC116298358 [Actinia tenebrosa]
MPRRPRIPSASSSSMESSFDFRKQIEFDATKSLIRSRSDCFLDSKRKQDKERAIRRREESTPWDVKPPDFRLQLYQPKPKTRNARESMIPDYDEDVWRREQRERTREKIKFERVPLPKILQKEGPAEKPFLTKFRIPDPYADKIMFVKDGKFHPGPYRNPDLPVFRADTFTKLAKKYGIPDFDSSYPHDPQGLIAKSNGLRVLCEAYKDSEIMKTDGYRKQLLTYKPQEPDWDVTLILPTGAYKKGRSAHSALMKRIEQQLPWCPDKDKLEPIRRPDIFDYKTVDWIAVTSHSRDESTRI